MTTLKAAAALLDMCHDYEFNGAVRKLDDHLDAIDAKQLRGQGSWPVLDIEPRILDWLPACRGVTIAQDADLWFYSISSAGIWFHPSVSGPNDAFDTLARCKTIERAQLLCEQHRRLRRAQAPMAATTSSG